MTNNRCPNEAAPVLHMQSPIMFTEMAEPHIGPEDPAALNTHGSSLPITAKASTVQCQCSLQVISSTGAALLWAIAVFRLRRAALLKWKLCWELTRSQP